ncbi:SdpI family protein [Flavobacterium sp. LHD-80]|uniref:SdpI family protein n=1 Tax=Flavobacterium sp. LHD-80 TaxID=3071411 RepID=UPI0027E06CB6|nr:SdpI family protein [Flavobacterium sp. LHD-80]MDQ6470999.1 SdpI family protein [Flavobacterium sp. LHD-80]
MNLELKKELPIIGIVLIPFAYLAFIWNSLPERVPVHWNINGEIDRWGSKTFLIVIVFILPALMYFVMFAAAKLDPKKRISLMGKKFYNLKFFMVSFMSLLAVFLLYVSKNQSASNPNLMYILVGILLMGMGNYFKVIQPNYFIGIRTPWTLESQEVWKATHAFAGKLWFFGGMIIILGGIIFSGFIFAKAFVGIGVTLALVPVAYSFFKFKQLEKKQENHNS